MSDEATPLLALAVGNSRARLGLFEGDELVSVQSFPIDQAAEARAWLDAQSSPGARTPLLIATVNPAGSDRFRNAIAGWPSLGAVVSLGRDVPIPIDIAVRVPEKVGQDRLLCAIGAWASTEGPCVVIDAGTAVTVDYIDAEGAFQGGAILPGIRLMLESLHRGTAALPPVIFDPARVDAEPIGKDTESAMLIGVTEAVRGSIYRLLERYADTIGTYPRVVATGGDASAIFGPESVVEHVVPDLQLIGMRLAFQAFLASDDEA